jgi:hypothetical protein
MTDPLENELAAAIQEDVTIKAMAQKLAPFPFGGDEHKAQMSVQKRSMVPVEHFAESLSTLAKTLAELKSLRNKLIGEAPLVGTHKPVEMRQAELTKKPVVATLHDQAEDVVHLASEMSAVIAQIRDKL